MTRFFFLVWIAIACGAEESGDSDSDGDSDTDSSSASDTDTTDCEGECCGDPQPNGCPCDPRDCGEPGDGCTYTCSWYSDDPTCEPLCPG